MLVTDFGVYVNNVNDVPRLKVNFSFVWLLNSNDVFTHRYGLKGPKESYQEKICNRVACTFDFLLL